MKISSKYFVLLNCIMDLLLISQAKERYLREITHKKNSMREVRLLQEMEPTERFNNIDYIAFGYDIYQGNPLLNDSGLDSGFKQPIFALEYSEDGGSGEAGFFIPEGVYAVTQESCSLSFTSDIIEGESSYVNSLKQQVSRSEGYKGTEFSASVDYQKIKSGLNSDDRYTLSHSTCLVSNIELSASNPPQLAESFMDAIQALPLTYNESQYRKILEDYGTHFLSKMQLGSRTSVLTSFNESSWKLLESQNLSIKDSASYSALINSTGASNLSEAQREQAEAFQEVSSSSKTITVGSKPPEDRSVESWTASSLNQSNPVMITLKPLSDLFTSTYFRTAVTAENLTLLKANFDKAINEYCTNLDDCMLASPDKAFGLVDSVLSFESSLHSGYFLRFYLKALNPEVRIDISDGSKIFDLNTTWEIKQGICEIQGTISFAPYNISNYYLRQRGSIAYVEEFSNTTNATEFKNDACFYPRKGFKNNTGLSFESMSYPGYYLSSISDGDRIGIINRAGGTFNETNAIWLQQLGLALADNIAVALEGGATYTVTNKNSDKVFSVAGAASEDGAQINQWGYWEGENQMWKVIDKGNGWYLFQALHSGKVLELSSEGWIIQSEKNAKSSQLWRVVPVGVEGWNILQCKDNYYAAEVNEFSIEDGAKIHGFVPHFGDNQLWKLSKL